MSIIKKVPKSRQRFEYIACSSDPIYFLNNFGKVFDARKQMISDMTCFEYQEDVLDDYMDNRFNITLKSRQCLPAGTYVNTPDGIKSIESFQEGDSVWSYNLKDQKVERDQVYDAWQSGIRECVTFKLRDTRNLTVGKNHPFFVEGKGWVKAGGLQRGDKILFEKPSFGNKRPKNSYVIALAYMITDGSALTQPKFTNNNEKYLSEFSDCVNELCPKLLIRKSPKENGFDLFPHQPHGSNTKNPFMTLCEEMGVNKRSEFKILPQEVFHWNQKSTALLINRLFAGDGWVTVHKRGKSKRLEIGIAAPCQKFLFQVKELLLRFNITSNIYEVAGMKKQKSKFWKLRITHSKACKNFVEQVGIFDKIDESHVEIINSYKHDVKYDSVVKKVSDAGSLMCYDISVAKNENFFVDGLLTHNTGLSVITAGYCAWRLMFGKDERILIIANDGKGAIRFLETVKQFIDYLPEFLKPKKPKNAPSVYKTENKKELVFWNKCQIEAKAASPQAGRGESLTLLVLDEVAFIKDAPEIWKAASTALSMTKGDAILISTPYGTGNLYHQIWSGAESGKNDFHPIRVHWTESPIAAEGLEVRIDDEGEEYPWSPWYEDQCVRLNNDPVAIAQELDLSFEGSKHLVVNAKIIKKYRDRLTLNDIDPLCYFDWDNMEMPFTHDRNPFYIWQLPDPDKSYIIGGDVSTGGGKDYSTLQVICVEDMEQVGELQIKIDPDELADIAYAAAKIYNDAFVAIEFNSYGSAACLRLNKELGYKNVFYGRSILDLHTRPADVRKRQKVVEGSTIPGFMTTTKTRPLLMECLIRTMRERQVVINSRRLLGEFDTFVKIKNKEQHEKGFNDDLIFAFAIALYMRETEWANKVKSRAQTKAMLNAWSFNTNHTHRTSTPEMEKRTKKKYEEAEKKINKKGYSPIFLGGSLKKDENRGDNWVLD